MKGRFGQGKEKEGGREGRGKSGMKTIAWVRGQGKARDMKGDGARHTSFTTAIGVVRGLG